MQMPVILRLWIIYLTPVLIVGYWSAYPGRIPQAMAGFYAISFQGKPAFDTIRIG